MVKLLKSCSMEDVPEPWSTRDMEMKLYHLTSNTDQSEGISCPLRMPHDMPIQYHCENNPQKGFQRLRVLLSVD